MKNTKLYIIMILMCITVSFSATANPGEEKALSELKTQIQDLLKKYPHPLPNKEDVLSKVEILINDRKQMVVLNIDTEDPQLVSFIQSRLNYKIVKHKFNSPTEKFVIPVRFRN